MLGVLTFWAGMHMVLVYSSSLRRPCTQANLDARAALAGEGRQQRREVDLVGVVEAVLRQRRRRAGAGGM